MDFLIARQPIFNIQGDVVAYELLFRSNPDNAFPDVDSDQATVNVMMDNFILNNVTTLTGEKRAFVNFTEHLLLNDYGFYLPREGVVIEILEDVPAHEGVLAACKKLRDAGYTLALDDFVLDPEGANAALIDHCDIIKVDYSLTDAVDRASIFSRLEGRDIQLLAEKIETREEYVQAREEGFEFFQGYFFARPEVLPGQRLPENQLSKMQLVRAANDPEFDVENIVLAIKRDVSLTYKLLRLINSAAFGFTKKVTSIKHAVVYMGLQELRKWVSFVAMADLCGDRSPELLKTALTRAHLGEQLAQHVSMRDQGDDLFITGLFSLADAMMGRTMEDILEAVPLSPAVQDALLGNYQLEVPSEGARIAAVLELVRDFEQGLWQNLDAHCQRLRLSQEQLLNCHNRTLQWVDEALAAGA